ncbi:MAG: hypothetical protein ABJK11_03120 [Balneola sp.]
MSYCHPEDTSEQIPDRLNQKTEDVLQFINSEIIRHPSDLTQVLDLSPLEGRFVSSFHQRILPS